MRSAKLSGDMDAIVIGSGVGGLTAALGLARAGLRVAVLEQHSLPGGWCHSFNLGGYRFSPGVHYIGGLSEGARIRGLFEGLDLTDDLVFLEMNPDGYDHVVIGDERIDIPADKQRYAERLKRRFPREAAGIDGYLDTCERMHQELQIGQSPQGWAGTLALPWRMRTVLRYGAESLSRFLDRFTRDPLLRAILSMQVGDHGLGPSEAPALLQAAIFGHYGKGAWYPMGGARSIPKAFIRQIRAHGGVVMVKTPVDKVLLEGRRVLGVRLGDGTEIRAPIVVSNADPGVTYGRLIGREHLPWRLARKLDRTPWSLSALSLFFAAEIDAEAHGLDSGNLWYSRDTDIDAGYRLAKNPDLDGVERLPGSFLAVTTLKDRTRPHNGIHTMESFCFVSYEAFRRWEDTALGARGADYERFKNRLAERMFATLEEVVPGLRERVVFHELGTPLTNAHYVASTQGNLYGTEKRLTHLGPMGYGVRTPFEGLYTVGASTLGHGVAGAMLSGVAAARAILRVGEAEVLTGRGHLRTLPADHPETWPDDVRPAALDTPADDVIAAAGAAKV